MKVLHVVGKRGGGIGRYLDILARESQLVWELNRGQPPTGCDVAVVHGYIPRIGSILRGIPLFFYFHGLRATSRRMVLGRLDPNPLNHLKLMKFKAFLRSFKGFLFPTASMKYRARKLYGVEGEVVYLPFDRELHTTSVFPIGRRILWVGREAWIKGLDTLLWIASELPEWEFRVVGVEGSNSGNLVFMGRVSTGELLRLYSSSTFTLVTSYYESFSYVVLESASQFTPVLVLSRAGGATEVLAEIGLGKVFRYARELVEYLKNYSGEVFRLRSTDVFEIKTHMNLLHRALTQYL